MTRVTSLIQFWDSGVYQTIGLTVLHLGIALSLRHVMERRYALLNSLPVMWLGAISYRCISGNNCSWIVGRLHRGQPFP